MKRDVRISAIRLICTLAVVALHICQATEKLNDNIHYFTEWLNLGLVMFFCISAYLYSKKEITNVYNWYIHRYSEIAIPSLILGIITIVVFTFKGNMDISKATGSLLCCLGFQVYSQNSWMFIQLWFLTYILFFYLTVPLIQKIKCEKVSPIKFWSIMAGAVFVAQILSVVIERVLGITLLSVGILLRFYLPYFAFKRYDINGTKIKPLMYIFTVLSVIFVFFICWIKYTPDINISNGIKEILFIYVQTLVGFTLFYWLYKFFVIIKNYNVILKLSDKYSYEIYLTHCLFVGYSTSLIYACSNVFVGIIAALLATAASSVLLNILASNAKKPINKLLKY